VPPLTFIFTSELPFIYAGKEVGEFKVATQIAGLKAVCETCKRLLSLEGVLYFSVASGC